MAVDSKMFTNNRLVAGVAWAQGQRDYMQDAFTVTLDSWAKDSDLDFLGVFDGHGPDGENLARFGAYKLCDLVADKYTEDDGTFAEAIEEAVFELDEIMRREDSLKNEDGEITGGSTCCCIWIKREEIYSCNVGDSRFIMSYQGEAAEVTHDHKPTNRKERNRVVKAGGYISSDDRINGILGVARSLGDFMFKEDETLAPEEQLVSPAPDIKIVDIDDDIDFMIIATDGLWDVWKNQEAITFVHDLMDEGTSLNKICEQFIRHSLQEFVDDPELGTCDNITVILAIFR